MPKLHVDDDDDRLDDLPPLDADAEVGPDVPEDALDAFDDGAGDDEAGDQEGDDGVDALDALAPGDDLDSDDADLGEDELDETIAMSGDDAEAPGVGEEDFGLGAPSLDDDGDGAEGFDEGDAHAGELPPLDGEDDDRDVEIRLVPDVPPFLRRSPLPPWQDVAWERAPDVAPPSDLRSRAKERAATSDGGLVFAIAARPSRLLVSRDGGATFTSRELVLSDGEPIDAPDARLAVADEAVAIVDPRVGVLVARGLGAPFVLAEACEGAVAATFLGTAVDAPLLVAIDGGDATYLARVDDDGSAALLAEIAPDGAQVEALVWDAAEGLVWVATAAGDFAFRRRGLTTEVGPTPGALLRARDARDRPEVRGLLRRRHRKARTRRRQGRRVPARRQRRRRHRLGDGKIDRQPARPCPSGSRAGGRSAAPRARHAGVDRRARLDVAAGDRDRRAR